MVKRYGVEFKLEVVAMSESPEVFVQDVAESVRQHEQPSLRIHSTEEQSGRVLARWSTFSRRLGYRSGGAEPGRHWSVPASFPKNASMD